MLKVFELLSRRSDTTHEAAMAYWTRHHAALARQSGANDAKTRRYVNNVGLRVGYEQSPPFATCPYDGVVAVWMSRSFAAFHRIMTSPHNIFIPDEPNFLRCRPYLMPVEEVVHRNDAGAATCKLIVLFTRPWDAADDRWSRHWRNRHVARELDYWGDRLARMTTNVAMPFVWTEWGEETAAYDGCAEYWFTIEPEAVIAGFTRYPADLIASQRQYMAASARMFVSEVIQIERADSLAPEGL